MKCQFCDSEAVRTCAWPVEKPETFSHWDVSEGDVVLDEQNRPVELASVHRFNYHERGIRIPVTMVGFPAEHGVCWILFLTGRDRLEMHHPALCGNAVCERHLREVGEERVYCSDHWRAWESAFTAVA